MKMIYDDSCGFCTRSKKIIESLDWFKTIKWIGITKYTGFLSKKELRKEIHLVEGKRVYRGFFAFKRASRKIVLLFPFWLISFIPGLDRLGSRVYSWIARNRHLF